MAARSESDLDTLSIDAIRFLAIDMVERAQSGHPGMPMGAAAMAYVLWTRWLRHSPTNPEWRDRDRFVLSAGHGSALLYALLHLTGYDLPLEELQRFRQWGSLTPGHPEKGRTPGVEVTTGPLGQGFANAVGIAMAERHLAAQFNRPGFPLVDHRTFVIASDGDMMEGVASEAASLAGHLRLGKLVCLYDSNHVSLSAATRITFGEDVGARFAAYGWDVTHVRDGNDLSAVDVAIGDALRDGTRPSLIVCRTHLGFGSPHLQDSYEAHGSPLGPEETAETKARAGWPADRPFHIPERACVHFRSAIDRGRELERAWESRYSAYAEAFPDLAAEWERYWSGALGEGWDRDVPTYDAPGEPVATRKAGHDVLNAIARRVTNLVGGSADLDPSTKTTLTDAGSFQPPGSGDDNVQGSPAGPWTFASRNIAFGVREHAMGGILNGMSAHGGVRPFGSTFLIFSDYLRPSIRLAALSRHDVIYVFTHDSIMLGEDGPTHQPIEQLASLRAIPNLVVIRPADAAETAEAWKVALETRGGPIALVFSRQALPQLEHAGGAGAEGLRRGAYILADPEAGDPQVILIATGSEVHVALEARDLLTAEGLRTRVVSMPSWELFARQPQSYRNAVLLPSVTARVAVEAASWLGWREHVGPDGIIVALDQFGASAPGHVNQERFGFTAERVAGAAHRALARAARRGIAGRHPAGAASLEGNSHE